MQYEHCSFCGNLTLTKLETPGMKKCQRCGWEGFPDKDPMDKINELARTYKPGTKWSPPIKASKKEDLENVEEIEGAQETINKNSEENREPIQKSLDPRKSAFRMDDREAFTSENKLGEKQISGKIPKNQELINRLKGKNISGADFL